MIEEFSSMSGEVIDGRYEVISIELHRDVELHNNAWVFKTTLSKINIC